MRNRAVYVIFIYAFIFSVFSLLSVNEVLAGGKVGALRWDGALVFKGTYDDNVYSLFPYDILDDAESDATGYNLQLHKRDDFYFLFEPSLSLSYNKRLIESTLTLGYDLYTFSKAQQKFDLNNLKKTSPERFSASPQLRWDNSLKFAKEFELNFGDSLKENSLRSESDFDSPYAAQSTNYLYFSPVLTKSFHSILQETQIKYTVSWLSFLESDIFQQKSEPYDYKPADYLKSSLMLTLFKYKRAYFDIAPVVTWDFYHLLDDVYLYNILVVEETTNGRYRERSILKNAHSFYPHLALNFYPVKKLMIELAGGYQFMIKNKETMLDELIWNNTTALYDPNEVLVESEKDDSDHGPRLAANIKYFLTQRSNLYFAVARQILLAYNADLTYDTMVKIGSEYQLAKRLKADVHFTWRDLTSSRKTSNASVLLPKYVALSEQTPVDNPDTTGDTATGDATVTGPNSTDSSRQFMEAGLLLTYSLNKQLDIAASYAFNYTSLDYISSMVNDDTHWDSWEYRATENSYTQNRIMLGAKYAF